MKSLFDFTMVEKFYHVSPEGAEHPIYQTSVTNFFEPAVLKETLSESGKVVQATSLALPASFVGTSLCKLSLIQLQFAAQYNELIELEPENLIFQIEKHDDHAHLGYRIKEVRSVTIPTDDRPAFLSRHWHRYFSNFITPAVETIAAISDLKPAAIWQQFGGQITYLKNFLLKHEKRADIVTAFVNDSEQLADLDPALFKTRRNPYQHKPRYVDHPLIAGEQWLMKSSCCLYDRRENGKLCYTCPRMKDEEREQRKRELVAAAEKKS